MKLITFCLTCPECGNTSAVLKIREELISNMVISWLASCLCKSPKGS